MQQNETENGDGEEIRQYFRSADLVELFERMEGIRKSNIDEKFYPFETFLSLTLPNREKIKINTKAIFNKPLSQIEILSNEIRKRI